MQQRKIKLKDVLNLVKNKRNAQYSFVLKKRALIGFGLTPNNILNISVSPIKKIDILKINPHLKFKK